MDTLVSPALLWLWCRLAATALIGPLAWEPPYAMGATQKKTKKKKKNQKTKNNKNKKKKGVSRCRCGGHQQVLVEQSGVRKGVLWQRVYFSQEEHVWPFIKATCPAEQWGLIMPWCNIPALWPHGMVLCSWAFLPWNEISLGDRGKIHIKFRRVMDRI